MLRRRKEKILNGTTGRAFDRRTPLGDNGPDRTVDIIPPPRLSKTTRSLWRGSSVTINRPYITPTGKDTPFPETSDHNL